MKRFRYRPFGRIQYVICSDRQRIAVLIEFLQFAAGFGLAIWFLLSNVARPAETGSLLLLIFWVLSLPALGQAIALAVRQYPMHRNVTLRLIEPLSAPETQPQSNDRPNVSEAIGVRPSESTRGVSIKFENVSLTVSGHPILRPFNLNLECGTYTAIVGRSGAGESSLIGLLLGLNTPSCGRIFVNSIPLEGDCLTRLREETAWVDPGVQVWNRSLAENLCYGSQSSSIGQLGRAITELELEELLKTLPEGLLTQLGEGGALLSGGEGQRIRLGRAMIREHHRLVIMDEPFAGLDRTRRHQPQPCGQLPIITAARLTTGTGEHCP
jgi:ABC-type multidrug transport system fused ATPase/permease subunit